MKLGKPLNIRNAKDLFHNLSMPFIVISHDKTREIYEFFFKVKELCELLCSISEAS